MRKIAILALSCVMVAGMFAGCRRGPANGTDASTATSSVTTTPTVQTTQPTQSTTRATENTQATTIPAPTGGSNSATGTTGDMESNRQSRPHY